MTFPLSPARHIISDSLFLLLCWSGLYASSFELSLDAAGKLLMLRHNRHPLLQNLQAICCFMSIG